MRKRHLSRTSPIYVSNHQQPPVLEQMPPISPQLPEAGWIRDHPLRAILTNEFHARPPEALHPPLRATYLAMLSGEAAGPRERAHVTDPVSYTHLTLPTILRV